MIRDPSLLCSGTVPGVYDGFAMDAWLGNWDVVGKDYDNIQVGGEVKGWW